MHKQERRRVHKQESRARSRVGTLRGSRLPASPSPPNTYKSPTALENPSPWFHLLLGGEPNLLWLKLFQARRFGSKDSRSLNSPGRMEDQSMGSVPEAAQFQKRRSQAPRFFRPRFKSLGGNIARARNHPGWSFRQRRRGGRPTPRRTRAPPWPSERGVRVRRGPSGSTTAGWRS